MGSDATNQKKFIMTVARDGSDQMATTRRNSLQYFKKGASGEKTGLRNYIETYKCAPDQACQRTKIGNWLLIHDQSHIGKPYGTNPSLYGTIDGPSAPLGVGVNGKKVEYFAIAADHSPNVMVEGHWLVRDADPTQQDNNNGPGVFLYNTQLTLVQDDSELIFKQCGVEKIILKCSHDRESVKSELHVYLGDTLTVTVIRKNAAESEKADQAARSKAICDFKLYQAKRQPPKEETKHAAFVLSRTGQAKNDFTEGWDLRKNITMVGDDVTYTDPETKAALSASRLTLPDDWLNEAAKQEAQSSGVGVKVTPPDTAKADAQRKAADREAYTANKASGEADYANRNTNSKATTASADAAHATLSQARDKQVAAKATQNVAQGAVQAQKLAENISQFIPTYQALKAMFFFQPMVITVAAHGCSSATTGTIKAYKPGIVTLDLWTLKDLPFKSTIETFEKLIAIIKDFLKNNISGLKFREFGKALVGAGANVELTTGGKEPVADAYLFRSEANGEDAEPKLALTAQWKELTRDAGESGEDKTFKKWEIHRYWELEVNVERLVGLKFTKTISFEFIPALKVIKTILDWLGVNAEAGMEFMLDLSVGVAGHFKYTEYGKFDGNDNKVAVKAKVGISLYAKLGDAASVELGVTGEWNPVFHLQKVEAELGLVGDPSTILIKGTLKGKIDVHAFGHAWTHETEWEIFTFPIDVSGNTWRLMGDKA